MRRFYLQIYATVVGILLLFSLLASLLWHTMSPSPRERRVLEAAGSTRVAVRRFRFCTCPMGAGWCSATPTPATATP